MFLTKKNAQVVNKGKPTPKKRPLGGIKSSYLGWEDDEETPAEKQTTSKTSHVPQQMSLLEDNNESSVSKKTYQ